MLAKMQETAIGAAFNRFGIRSEDVELDIAFAKYRNRGGTFERAEVALKKAFADELPGRVGQNDRANSGGIITGQPRQPFQDTVARDLRAAQRCVNSAKVEATFTRAITSLFDRKKASDGRGWGDIGAHEWAGMDRDGAIARALIDYHGPLNEKQRFKPVRELMTEEQFGLLLARVEGQAK